MTPCVISHFMGYTQSLGSTQNKDNELYLKQGFLRTFHMRRKRSKRKPSSLLKQMTLEITNVFPGALTNSLS